MSNSKTTKRSKTAAGPAATIEPNTKIETSNVHIDGTKEWTINVDHISGISGWIWDRQKPYDPIELEVVVADQVIATCLADQFSMELIDRQIGNGKHGFSIKIDRFPDIALPTTLVVRILASQLVLCEILISKIQELAPIVVSMPVGHVDGVINGTLRGWACDRVNSKSKISVDIQINGEIYSTIYCSDFREDLFSAGIGDGYCGFTFDLPIALLDDQPSVVNVCFSGTLQTLPMGVLHYSLSQQNSLIALLTKLEVDIKTCQNSIKKLEERLMQRHEALITIQRENIERELQVLRKLFYAESSHNIPALSNAPTTEKLKESPSPSTIDLDVDSDKPISVSSNVILSSPSPRIRQAHKHKNR